MTEQQLEKANKLKSRIRKLELFLESLTKEYIAEQEGVNINEKTSLWEIMLQLLPFNYHTKYSNSAMFHPYELETDEEMIDDIRIIVEKYRDKYKQELQVL